MSTLPRDVADLHLAPVILAVDAKIVELASLALSALATRIAIESGWPTWSRADREHGLLDAIGGFIDGHGWTLSYDARGVRLSHGAHTVVLGVPATFGEYLDGATCRPTALAAHPLSPSVR